MPSSGFSRLSNLPGQATAARTPVQNPIAQVQSFQNQKLPGLSTGTTETTGQGTQAGLSPAQQLIQMRKPASGVQLSARRTTDAVRSTNNRLMQLAQANGAKRRQQAQAQQSSRTSSVQQGGQPRGASGPVRGGTAVSRIQGILKGFPGLRITETLGDRAYDVRNGVARVPTSYHYDQANPAVDIAGSPAQLNALYNELVRQGGWRQILWQVPGHYDHIHVAAEGGVVGHEEFDTAIATSPEEIPESDTVPTMLSPGEGIVTAEATERIGPDKIAALNDGAELADLVEPEAAAFSGSYQMPGVDVSAIVTRAYEHVGQGHHSQKWQGQNVPGVRTNLANLRPGDIVAWKDGSHVAVYAGNGEVLDKGNARRKLWAPEGDVFGIALRLPGE